MAGAYAYATVEKALAAVFSIDSAARKHAFRARIQHLQRLKLAPKWPGKGRIITYNDAAVWAWMLALEAEELGWEPQMIVRLVKDSWNYLLKVIKLAQKEPADDVYLCLVPRMMSGTWLSDSKKSSWPVFSYARKSGAKEFFEFLDEDAQRACIFNLSARLRELEKALRAVQEKEGETLNTR
jgi:hypothetical protein